MSNGTSTAVRAGLLTLAVFVASAVILASSLKSAPVETSYTAAAVQHADNSPNEIVTVVGTRRAS